MKTRLKKAWKALIGRDIRNSYDAGRMTRTTADWPTQIYSPTSILRLGLRNMRARSRELEINNDYAKKFLWMVGMNVGGPEGVKFQNKAMYVPGGILDKGANDKIETAWAEWNKKGNFDVTGQLDGALTDGLVPRTVARDGELLIRIVEGFDNEWGFALQFLEADYLWEYLNVARLPNGNSIRMGVEFDKWFRPVAYHLLSEHPGDGMWTYNSMDFQRVPAEQIIHLFMVERFNQPRGVPWMHSAMTRLNNIGAYEEAEIVNARIGASDMGWYAPGPDADPESIKQYVGDEKDAAGNLIREVEPGSMGIIPPGWDIKQFDPKHPAGNFAPFMKAALRGVASGMLVSYNNLANDLEGVNYSSLRSGALEERDSWKLMQAWSVVNYKRPIFERWLKMALLTQKVYLPASKFAQFNKPKFSPRVWAWVDPLKDLEAVELEINNQLTSRTDVSADRGEDYEEVLIKLQEEKRLRKKYGIEEPASASPKVPGTQKPTGDEPGAPQPNTGDQMQQALTAMANAMNAVTELIKDFKNSSLPATKPEEDKRP